MAVLWHSSIPEGYEHQLPNHILLETCWMQKQLNPQNLHDVAYL